MTHEQYLDEPDEYVGWCVVFSDMDAEVDAEWGARRAKPESASREEVERFEQRSGRG